MLFRSEHYYPLLCVHASRLSMSLSKAFRMPQLRAVSRPALTASMSSLPGSSFRSSELFTTNNESDLVSNLDDAPPTPPRSAYPPSQSNPLTQTKDMTLSPREKEKYSLYVNSTDNNNILTFTRPDGGPVCTISSGMVGFKNKNRANAEAAHACAMRVFSRIEQEAELKGHSNMSLEVKFRGFTRGREAVYKALLGSEGDKVRPLVGRVTDMTAIKIGGTRAKKARRM